MAERMEQDFLYYEKRFMEKIKRYELDILHNDYHILNSYIVKNILCQVIWNCLWLLKTNC